MNQEPHDAPTGVRPPCGVPAVDPMWPVAPGEEGPPPDWFAAEDALHDWGRELGRLKRRAKTRLWLTLTLAVAATFAFVGWMSRGDPLHSSRVLLRVSESALVDQDAALVGGDLAEYLRDVAFTTPNLLALIKTHDLYPLARARGDLFAVDQLRSNMEVEVFRNYFIARRSYNEPLRTARVAVSFHHRVAATAVDVTHDLADLVVETESKRRREASEMVARFARKVSEAREERLGALERRQRAAQAELDSARARGDRLAIAAIQVELTRIADQQKRHEIEVRQAEATSRQAHLQHAMAETGTGLFFDIVDTRVPPPPPVLRDQLIRYAVIGLFCFVFCLPLCAIFVGAFDRRVHRVEDIEWLGIDVLGEVPTSGRRRGRHQRHQRRRRRRRSRRGHHRREHRDLV